MLLRVAASDPFGVDGYVVLPELLTGREVRRFRGAVARLRTARPSDSCERPRKVHSIQRS